MENTHLITTLLLAAATLSVAHRRPAPAASPAAATAVSLAKAGKASHHHTLRTTGKKAGSTFVYTVTATAYQPEVRQTDNEPFVTADNSVIRPHYSSRTRWIALSRDLLARWGGDFQFGDRVLVSGISPRLDGVYTIHDTMNKRLRHRIDVLTHTREKMDICTKNVKIRLLAPTASADSVPAMSRRRATSLARLRRRAAPAGGPAFALAAGLAKHKHKHKRATYFASAIL